MIETITTERLVLKPQLNNKAAWRHSFDIILNGTDTVIGYIRFHQYLLRKKIAECAYRLDKAFTGNGYMTEAVLGLKNILNKTTINGKCVKQLEFKIDDCNIKSKNVMDRVGARLESKGSEYNYYRLEI